MLKFVICRLKFRENLPEFHRISVILMNFTLQFQNSRNNCENPGEMQKKVAYFWVAGFFRKDTSPPPSSHKKILKQPRFCRTVETLKQVAAVTRALNMDVTDPNPIPTKDVKRGLTDPVTRGELMRLGYSELLLKEFADTVDGDGDAMITVLEIWDSWRRIMGRKRKSRVSLTYVSPPRDSVTPSRP